MFAEHGIIESAQLAAWAAAFLAGVGFLLKRPPPRERLFALWLCLVASLAALREMDAHTLLNPETLGAWGVRYRLDWWLSAGAPIGARMLWFVVGALMAGAVVASTARVASMFDELRRGHEAAWVLFALAGAGIVCGYLLDDILGRGRIVPAVYTQGLEESLELAGAVLYTAGVLRLHHHVHGWRGSVTPAA